MASINTNIKHWSHWITRMWLNIQLYRFSTRMNFDDWHICSCRNTKALPIPGTEHQLNQMLIYVEYYNNKSCDSTYFDIGYTRKNHKDENTDENASHQSIILFLIWLLSFVNWIPTSMHWMRAETKLNWNNYGKKHFNYIFNWSWVHISWV